MNLLLLLVALSTAFCLPLEKRIESFSANEAYTSVLTSTWKLFWNEQLGAFNLNDPSCSKNFSLPAVWDVAVVAKAIIESGNNTASQKVLTQLYSYQSSNGWFTALPNQTDAFTDDNAQIVWALLTAYDLTKDEKHLATAKQLVKLIQGQWSDIGELHGRQETHTLHQYPLLKLHWPLLGCTNTLKIKVCLILLNNAFPGWKRNSKMHWMDFISMA